MSFLRRLNSPGAIALLHDNLPPVAQIVDSSLIAIGDAKATNISANVSQFSCGILDYTMAVTIGALPTGGPADFKFRYFDNSNEWFLRVNTSGDVRIFSRLAGAATEEAALGTLPTGIVINITVSGASITYNINGGVNTDISSTTLQYGTDFRFTIPDGSFDYRIANPNYDVPTKHYLVTTTGSDAAAGSNIAPFLTIGYALATVSDLRVIVHIADGTYSENVSATGYLYITQTFTTSVTLKAETSATVVIENASGTTYCVLLSLASNLHFEDIDFIPTGGNSGGTIRVGSNAVTNVSFTNCTIDAYSSCFRATASGDIYTGIVFDNCVLKRKTGEVGDVFCIYGLMDDGGYLGLSLNNCTMTGVGLDTVWVKSAHANGDFDVTISGGTYDNTVDSAITAEGGTLNISNVVATVTTAICVSFGNDSGSSFATDGYIRNSTITSDSSHALIVAHLSANVDVSNNTINGGDHALVIKQASDITITDNNLIAGTSGAPTALYFKGSVDCVATGNTLSGSSNFVVQTLWDDGSSTLCQNIQFTDNTVTATGSADIFYWGGDTHDEGGGVCNNNTYDISATSANLGRVRGDTNVEDLTQLQAAWSDYDVTTNDDSSTVIT